MGVIYVLSNDGSFERSGILTCVGAASSGRGNGDGRGGERLTREEGACRNLGMLKRKKP